MSPQPAFPNPCSTTCACGTSGTQATSTGIADATGTTGLFRQLANRWLEARLDGQELIERVDGFYGELEKA